MYHHKTDVNESWMTRRRTENFDNIEEWKAAAVHRPFYARTAESVYYKGTCSCGVVKGRRHHRTRSIGTSNTQQHMKEHLRNEEGRDARHDNDTCSHITTTLWVHTHSIIVWRFLLHLIAQRKSCCSDCVKVNVWYSGPDWDTGFGRRTVSKWQRLAIQTWTLLS